MQQPGDRSSRMRALAAICGAAFLILSLASCGPRTDTHGNLVDPALLSQIKPGESGKGDVQTVLGTPSSVATFDPNTWYYIGKETRRFAFFDPQVLQERVVQISFDSKGKVKDIQKYGEDDTKDISIVSRTTPTRGESLGMMDDLWNTMVHQFTTSAGADANSRDPFYRGK